ncbi:MAG: guanine deaminase [Clostridiaceae bacterium]
MVLSNTSTKIYKGNILFTKSPYKFTVFNNGFIIVEDGKIQSVCDKLPKKYINFNITDYKDKLIIPGMTDLHCHGPQFRNLGIAMDKELLPWLELYTFPEESKFKDPKYSKMIFSRFIKEVWRQGTTRISVYSTIHKETSMQLMEMFIQSGLGAYIGKVNMDRNVPSYLMETLEDSVRDTEEILIKYSNLSSIVKPIITPRFVPSCTSELMSELGKLSQKFNVPIQSHLSENRGEVKWIQELYPDSSFYGEVYNRFGLFGQSPTLMAHCSYSSEDEMNLMKSNNVIAVHCPASNLNLGSGMMPVRKFINKGILVALGSDISGGHSCSVFKSIVSAVQISKLLWSQSDKKSDFLSLSEAFYMATKAGGSFFGKVGDFEEGYDFDALIIDDSELNFSDFSLEQRLERFIYLGDDRHILHRYVCGNLIDEPVF